MNECTEVIDQWYWINEEFCSCIESYKTTLFQRPELFGGRGSQDHTLLMWVPHHVPGKELCVSHSLLFFVSKLPKQRDIRRVGQKDPLEKGMATHSDILAWRIPQTEEPGSLQSMESQRVKHNWVTNVLSSIIWGRVYYLLQDENTPSVFPLGLSPGGDWYVSRIGN